MVSLARLRVRLKTSVGPRTLLLGEVRTRGAFPKAGEARCIPPDDSGQNSNGLISCARCICLAAAHASSMPLVQQSLVQTLRVGDGWHSRAQRQLVQIIDSGARKTKFKDNSVDFVYA
jgi:hypothetical protein